MKSFIAFVLFGLLVHVNTSFAEESTQENIDAALELAKTFAECSGTYKAYAEFTEKNFPDKKNIAKTYKGIERGAYFSSAYLLNTARSLQNRKVLKLGKHSPYIDSVSETHHQHIKGLFEINAIESANKFLSICIALQKFQAEIVNNLRKEMYDLE